MTRFEETLANYVHYIQRINNEYFAEHLKNLTPPKIVVDKGRRYMKIVVEQTTGSGRSVHSFVEKETGNVFKAAGWRAPAKHVRANIYDYDSIKRGTNMHGANYMVR